MREVCEAVWVGDIADARAVLGGERQGFTHVLSMVRDQVPIGAAAHVARKVVPLDDEEVENLLRRLDECLEFIEQAVRAGGTVLVHCFGGHSRSVAVIVAYLMKLNNISAPRALARVTYHQVNKGFLKQLDMFQRMGYVVNKDDPEYKLLNAASAVFHDCVEKGLPWRRLVSSRFHLPFVTPPC